MRACSACMTHTAKHLQTYTKAQKHEGPQARCIAPGGEAGPKGCQDHGVELNPCALPCCLLSLLHTSRVNRRGVNGNGARAKEKGGQRGVKRVAGGGGHVIRVQGKARHLIAGFASFSNAGSRPLLYNNSKLQPTSQPLSFSMQN